jgi:5'-3' exonuclease
MQQSIDQHEKILFHPSSDMNKLVRFTHELEYYPIIHKSQLSISPMSDPQWRLKYYHHLFGSSASSMVKQCVLKYIEGLCWITNYYFNHRHDVSWYYPYDYSPSSLDIYKYVCAMSEESLQTLQRTLTQTPPHQEISCVHQMLIVLPPHSKHFVPQRYQCLYEDVHRGCVHLFPKKFHIETFMKTQLWECMPVLPLVPSNDKLIDLTKIE